MSIASLRQRLSSKENVILVAILVATFFLFLPAVFFSYIRWDDNVFVFENPLMSLGFTDIVRASFGQFFFDDYLPMTLLSHWFDTWIAGGTPDARVSHAFNILFHLANVGLAWLWLRPFVNDLLSRAFVTLVFAVHPLQVESVAWVSERKGLLCVLFTFAALLLLRKSESSRWSRWGSVVLFALALLSKATTLLVPFALFISDRFVMRKTWRDAFRTYGALMVLSVGFGVVRVLAYGNMSPDFAVAAANTNRFLAIPLVVLNAFGFYARKFFLPLNLSIIYPGFVFDSSIILNLGFLFLFAALCFVIWRSQRRSELLALMAIAFACFVPVLQFVPRVNYVNDRYVYFPILTMAWIFATAGERANRRLCEVALGSFVVLCFVLSFSRLGVWKSDTTFWESTAEAAPWSGGAQLSWGLSLEKAGDYKAAADHYLKAAEMGEDVRAQALSNLGTLHANPQLPVIFDLVKAEGYFERALHATTDPRYLLGIRFNIARLKFLGGKNEEARSELRQLITDVEKSNDSRYLEIALRAQDLLSRLGP